MPNQQGSTFLTGVKYFLKKGQTGVIRHRSGLMPMEFYQCFTLGLILTNDLQPIEVAFADYLTVAGKFADIKYFWDTLATFRPK